MSFQKWLHIRLKSESQFPTKTMEPELSIFGRRKEEMQIAEARQEMQRMVFDDFLCGLSWPKLSDWTGNSFQIDIYIYTYCKLTGIEVNECKNNCPFLETSICRSCMSCAWIPCMLPYNIVIVDCK